MPEASLDNTEVLEEMDLDNPDSEDIVSDGEEVTVKDPTETSAAIENCIEWIKNDKVMCLTISQRSLITKIKKLAEKFPDEVKIRRYPENNEGYLLAQIPVSYLHISHRTKVMSDEQRKAAGERLSAYRKGKKVDDIQKETTESVPVSTEAPNSGAVNTPEQEVSSINTLDISVTPYSIPATMV